MATVNSLLCIVFVVSCTYATEVRLNGTVDGTQPGLLEIKENGTWIAVSGSKLGPEEMRVVCRSAGLSGDNPKYFTLPANDNHTYKVLDIQCIGNETNIDQCVQVDMEWDHWITYITCQEFQFRLTGGGDNDGIVEVMDGTVWRRICIDFPFSDRVSAKFLCRELGLASSNAVNVDVARYPKSSKKALPIQMNCDGVENKTNCSFERVLNGSYCDQFIAIQLFAAVLCSDDPLQYRLADNVTTHSGRFEILVNNTWGPVCSSDFSDSQAVIACKSLGLPSGDARYIMGEYNGGGFIPSLGGGGCGGSETSFEECPFAKWAPVRCRPEMFVSLRCAYGGIEDQVRLTGGYDDISGRVEVYHNGTWGGFCYSGFDKTAAEVVCRNATSSSMKYSRRSSTSSLGYVSGRLVIENITCTGNEDNLLDCDHSAFGDISTCHYWKLFSNAGVVCGYGDERLRLNGTAGLLMVQHNNEWGTFCGKYSFRDVEAQVACKTLGLSSSFAQRKFETDYRQERSGRIWMEQINCKGNESNILECPMGEWGKVSCGHEDDVFLSCRDIDKVSINYTLRGDPMENVGYLLMDVDGERRSICDESFGTNEAQVACRSMGLRTDGAMVISSTNSEFASRTTFSPPSYFWQAGLKCDGTETSLLKCQHNYIGEINAYCFPRDAVVLYCGPPDGNNYDVRLSGGSDGDSGRVEMKMYGQWGTLCNDRITGAAEVICRYLGKPSSRAKKTTKFGGGTGIRWTDRMICFGHESTLADCKHFYYGSDDCTHLDDLGVQCRDWGFPVGGIVGVVIGCVGLVIFVISMIACVVGRKKQKNAAAILVPVQYNVQGFVGQNAAPQYDPGMFSPPPSYENVTMKEQSKPSGHDNSAWTTKE